jgi:hypothetical protein
MSGPDKLVFVLGRFFQLGLMFANKARGFLGEVGSTHKHLTILEKSARNKHTSLFGPLKSYEENKVVQKEPQGP